MEQPSITGQLMDYLQFSEWKNMPTGTNLRADRGPIVVFIIQPASSPRVGLTKPLIQRVGTQDPVSLGVKRPERKINHSPPSGSEIQNVYSVAFTPLYTSISWGIDTEATLPQSSVGLHFG